MVRLRNTESEKESDTHKPRDGYTNRKLRLVHVIWYSMRIIVYACISGHCVHTVWFRTYFNE